MTGLEIDSGPVPPRAYPEITDPEKAKHAETLEPIEVDYGEQDEENAIQRQTTTSSSPLPSKARTTGLVVTLTGAAFLNVREPQVAIHVAHKAYEHNRLYPFRQQSSSYRP